MNRIIHDFGQTRGKCHSLRLNRNKTEKVNSSVDEINLIVAVLLISTILYCHPHKYTHEISFNETGQKKNTTNII